MKKILIFLISYAVAFGILAAVIHFSNKTDLSIFMYALAIIMAIAGWRFINFITPAFFLWLPLGGWLIYVSVKFIVSGVLGLFIVPYHIAKFVIDNTDS